MSILSTALWGPFRADSSLHTSLFVHVIFGSVATSALLAAGVDPVLASSGATVFYLIIASLLRFKRQQPAAVFCGTFAGMTSLFVFFNKAPFSLGFAILVYLCVAIVTGSLYVLTGLNITLSASVCGFVGGLVFLSLPPLGPIANLYWYAGNFAGMSSTSILHSHPRILLAGAMTGVFLAGLHYYG